MKLLIMDSSSIITLAMNNLLYLLEKMKKEDIRFIITKDVEREIVEKPAKIKKYELEAMVIKKLITEKILEMPEDIGISSEETKFGRREFMDIANHTFRAGNAWMNIIGDGEASCLALARIAEKKGLNNILMIDERTARMLCEKPENLLRLFESKLHTPVNAEKSNFKFFSGLKIIRSSEFCYVAYRKGLVEISDGRMLLDALLYATKFKGCAISKQEIEQIKRLN